MMETYVRASSPLNELIGRSLNTGKTITVSEQDLNKLREMEKTFKILSESSKTELNAFENKKYNSITNILKNNQLDKILEEIDKKTPKTN